MRSKRVVLSLCFGVVAGVLITDQSSWAQSPFGASGRPRPIPAILPQGATQLRLPKGLSAASVSVMVELTGDPVTVADANVEQTMSTLQRQQVKNALKSQQAPVAASIRALGGRIDRDYQSAYNGLRVTVPGNKLAALSRISGVKGVHAFTPKSISNIHGVPLIGAPQVWAGALGVHGEGIRVAIIDTGIDYTHADFKGPGTPAAYQAALATDTAPADPSLFGPNAPRVKGGIDLVGDDYNADPNSAGYQPVPHPDPNPLDCNGHGTHTAGTAAGSGVLSTGAAYTGSYDANTVAGNNWNVGPGVAPKADIYSIRVFGCEGSTDVVVDAIEWAVENGMHVINMSLGSPYGGADDPDAIAADNAAKDGVIVVASAGNNGFSPYLVGDPSTSSRAISVAANDATASFPGANVALSTGSTVQAVEANGISVAGLTNVQVVVLPDGAGGISLGCDPNEYVTAGVSGKIAVVKRGTCARVARAIFGQEAGAVAVIMVNNATTFPPLEGQITNDPDTGQQFTVTIPFLGVPSTKGATLLAANGGTATLTDTQLPNPGFLAPASFTSGGPRSGDSALKPDVTAPGVGVVSAGMGTGNGPATLSGTSMSSPHTAGAAALVRQAHPTWKKVEYWKAALVNTADPTLVQPYATQVSGAGLVQVQSAAATQVVAYVGNETATVNYGFAELLNDFSKTKTVTLKNFGSSSVTFDIGHTEDSGDPHSLSLPGSVSVPAKGTAQIDVTLTVPAATTGDSSAFHDVAGLITFAPESGLSGWSIPRSAPSTFIAATAPSTGSARMTGCAAKTSCRDSSARWPHFFPSSADRHRRQRTSQVRAR